MSRITAQLSICDHENVQHEVTVESSNNENDNVYTELIQGESVVHESVQCTLLGGVTLEKYRTHKKAINYYTGFFDFGHFQFFLHCLGPAASELINHPTVISPIYQLFET